MPALAVKGDDALQVGHYGQSVFLFVAQFRDKIVAILPKDRLVGEIEDLVEVVDLVALVSDIETYLKS